MEGIREDTIFAPNTFSPAQKVADEFGLPLYEAANYPTDDQFFDPLSGQQAYKCFACRVRKTRPGAGLLVRTTAQNFVAFTRPPP